MSEWRRFERSSRDGSSDQFWSVRVVDRVVEIEHGWIDHPPPDEDVRTYARASAARAAVNQKIRTRLRRGWIEVEVANEARASELPGSEVLELAIASDPSKLDNWTVYADFLQELEPVLGERLALGLALARAESQAEHAPLEAQIERLERSHARELFGLTLARAKTQPRLDDVIELERRFGMIVGARLHEPISDIIKFDGLVRALLESPLARVLIDLHIHVHVETWNHARIVDMLVAARRPCLRRLTLGRARNLCMTYDFELPPIQTLLDTAPNLERLELHGPFPGAATHPSLRELKFGRPGRTPPLKLPSWDLPALETLHLGDPGPVDWSRVEFPRLQTLLIDWMDHGDELVASLARAPLLTQLASLVLDNSELTDAGIQTMLDHAEVFARLPRIVVLDVFVTPDRAAQLRRYLPNVLLGVDSTRGDPDGIFAPSSAEHDALTRF